MRRRRPRYERVKFRELDARAREALATMLERLPPAPVGTEGSRRELAPTPAEEARGGAAASGWRGDIADLESELGRLLAATGGLRSPLAFYAFRLEGDRLLVVEAQVVEDADPHALPRWEERLLGSVRRSGPATYVLET